MSIERIKEFNNKVNSVKNDNVQWDKLMLLCAIADYLIEQEEQKEKEKIDNFIKEQYLPGLDKVAKELGATVCYDPVVEVGQIWRMRHDMYSLEIKAVDNVNVCAKVEFIVDEKIKEECMLFETIIKHHELVTTDNIKEGEWVECIKTCYNDAGVKLKVCGLKKANSRTYVYFEDKSVQHIEDFKPCLPPVKKEPVKPERLQYVEGVISRFNLVGTEVPDEWVKERDELTAQVNEGCAEMSEEWYDATSVADMLEGKKIYISNLNNTKTSYVIEDKEVFYTKEDLDEAREEGIRQGYKEFGERIIKYITEPE